MTSEADLLSSKFFWKNIYFSGLFREKHILFITMIQGKTVLFRKNSGQNIPKNVYEPCAFMDMNVSGLVVFTLQNICKLFYLQTFT